jgi:hypothetical protein
MKQGLERIGEEAAKLAEEITDHDVSGRLRAVGLP